MSQVMDRNFPLVFFLEKPIWRTPLKCTVPAKRFLFRLFTRCENICSFSLTSHRIHEWSRNMCCAFLQCTTAALIFALGQTTAKTDLLPVLNGLNPACHLSQFVDIRHEAGLHLQPVCPGMLTRWSGFQIRVGLINAPGHCVINVQAAIKICGLPAYKLLG